MELEEVLEISILLDYYKSLLSDKQKEYLIEHLENDLSLSEIGEKYNVSRQAIYDNIKRGIQILKNYETKMNCYKRDRELLDELKKLEKDFKKEKLKDIIEHSFRI